MVLRLGINIDHVATLRNARGGDAPSPLRAAKAAIAGGADLITAHLREDRRHIRDADMLALKNELDAPLNMEMAVTDEMQRIALEIRPHAVCLVPEHRTEITTEGGLDVKSQIAAIAACTQKLQDAGILVSLFIDPDLAQMDAAKMTGARAVEIHTGAYANSAAPAEELKRIADAARHAKQIGLQVHAGHGLTFANVRPVAAIATIEELNIGHFLVGEAVFTGLESSVREMKKLMQEARQKAAA
jgi:pyridoxine 5-phosphate synthase